MREPAHVPFVHGLARAFVSFTPDRAGWREPSFRASRGEQSPARSASGAHGFASHEGNREALSELAPVVSDGGTPGEAPEPTYFTSPQVGLMQNAEPLGWPGRTVAWSVDLR